MVTMNFDDDSNNDWNRQKVLERLSMVSLPVNLQPAIGPDYSPVGQLYWYTLTSTNPQYDLMELKSLQDWTIAKQLKSVSDVIDVSSFGGLTREYQVQVDPNKLISYGLEPPASRASAVEQQRKCGRQFHPGAVGNRSTSGSRPFQRHTQHR